MSYYVLYFGATRCAAMLVGYARTSTKEQEAGFEAPKAELQKHGCEGTVALTEVGQNPARSAAR
ncbi:MAG: hypothetical protein WA970_18195, partial [Gammaproteobacteria bacterium]